MTSGVAADCRVFDLQRFSIHDGPGIRTTVFLEGCPLRCAWCQNPEAFAGGCARPMSAAAIVAEVRKDDAFYRTSGGGLTVSGGEPLQRIEPVRALLTEARRHGLHTCVQTCGAVPEQHFAAVLGLVDLFQFDLKHLDPGRHRALTGADPTRIHHNAAFLVARHAAVQFRMPLVPGTNDDRPNLEATARFLLGLGVRHLRLVPYQRLYLQKARDLGLTPALASLEPPTAAEVQAARSWLMEAGIETAIDG